MLQVILPKGYSPDAKEGEEGGGPIRVIDGMHRTVTLQELLAAGWDGVDFTKVPRPRAPVIRSGRLFGNVI